MGQEYGRIHLNMIFSSNLLNVHEFCGRQLRKLQSESNTIHSIAEKNVTYNIRASVCDD